MKNNLTLGSLFDGIGGFPYAASFYRIKTLWASEVLPAAISVTKRHFPDMEHVGDITKLHGDKLAPVCIITFGSPYQGLSLAGARHGLADERSGLFSEAIRIIYEMREATNGQYPKYAIWENVVGAMSTSGGRDFKAVLEAFAAAGIPMPESGKWAKAGMVRSGSVDIAWCVYNAQYFGTAQRRKRIFLIADFTGRNAGEILFVPKSLRRYYQAGGTPRQAAAAYAESGSGAADTENMNCAAFLGGASPSAGSIAYNEKISPTLKSGNSGSNMVPCVCEPGIARTLTARGDSSPCVDRGQNVVTLCTATGQAGSEVLENKSPTLNCNHEQPIITFGFDLQQITSKENRSILRTIQPTLCSGGNPHIVGLSLRNSGEHSKSETNKTLLNDCLDIKANEGDRCIVEGSVTPIHDRATRCAGGGATRNDDGSGNGLGIGKDGDPAPTVTAGDRHSVGFSFRSFGDYTESKTSKTLLSQDDGSTGDVVVDEVSAIDCRNSKEIGDMSGTLQAKSTPGYSLNYQNPVRMGYTVRRLTPTECERLQGFPDGWTEYGHDGKPISDSKRYQMLGNSVAVPCVAYIIEGIIQE